MKKLLTSLLCVMMVVCFMPSMAWADDSETQQESSVVKVVSAENTETYYDNFADAISKAADGETVILLKDVECAPTIIRNGITLDLNGKTLTIIRDEDNKWYGLAFVNGDSTIKNGTIIDDRSKDNESGNWVTILFQGKTDSVGTTGITENLTVKSYQPKTDKYYNYLIRVTNGAEYTANAGTSLEELTAADYDGKTYGVVGMTIYGNSDQEGNTPLTKLTLNEGVKVQVTGFAVSGNGSFHGTEINILGGELISKESTGIYHPQDGVMNISGGRISGETGIEVRAGEVNVNGGEIVGTGSPIGVSPNGNGTTSSGAGIAVAQHTTQKDITVNISGGVISGYSGLYESNPQKNPEDAIEKVVLNIVGGEFSTVQGGTQVIYSEDKTAFISGGTYSNDVTTYVEEGKTSVSVTSAGETIYYVGTAESVADTLENKVKSGDVITVQQGNLELEGIPGNVKVVNTAEDNSVKVNHHTVVGAAEYTTPVPYIPTTPTAQKPVIEPNADVTTSLSTDGTTLTIKANDGYEITDVTVNGVSKGAVDKVTGLKTGDKIVIKTQKIETPDDNAALIDAVKNTKLDARTAMSKAKGKKAVKVYWYAEDGSDLEFDGYEVFRSLKRYSGFGKTPFFKTANEKYYNTAVKKGSKYYYKVRAYKVIDGEKVYTDWSTKAWRTVK